MSLLYIVAFLVIGLIELTQAFDITANNNFDLYWVKDRWLAAGNPRPWDGPNGEAVSVDGFDFNIEYPSAAGRYILVLKREFIGTKYRQKSRRVAMRSQRARVHPYRAQVPRSQPRQYTRQAVFSRQVHSIEPVVHKNLFQNLICLNHKLYCLYIYKEILLAKHGVQHPVIKQIFLTEYHFQPPVIKQNLLSDRNVLNLPSTHTCKQVFLANRSFQPPFIKQIFLTKHYVQPPIIEQNLLQNLDVPKPPSIHIHEQVFLAKRSF
ncbi:hypothetical protein G7Y89_g2828 [Cudoniella acicularis]|uniref:Uncharacterized protein n=1 Tax=Cudoniella acicularis TaxID=354080 RepID=A0A8H4RTU6_9HELO|nr:hypothetical protein G7Y89_g2828 [Cudoniella acicularis]